MRRAKTLGENKLKLSLERKTPTRRTTGEEPASGFAGLVQLAQLPKENVQHAASENEEQKNTNRDWDDLNENTAGETRRNGEKSNDEQKDGGEEGNNGIQSDLPIQFREDAQNCDNDEKENGDENLNGLSRKTTVFKSKKFDGIQLSYQKTQF